MVFKVFQLKKKLVFVQTTMKISIFKRVNLYLVKKGIGNFLNRYDIALKSVSIMETKVKFSNKINIKKGHLVQ